MVREQGGRGLSRKPAERQAAPGGPRSPEGGAGRYAADDLALAAGAAPEQRDALHDALLRVRSALIPDGPGPAAGRAGAAGAATTSEAGAAAVGRAEAAAAGRSAAAGAGGAALAAAETRAQAQPAALQATAGALARELAALIDRANWPAVRAVCYPRESAAGVTRAKERRAGTRPDLTGVGSRIVLDRFAAEVRAIRERWGTLPPDRRLARLGTSASAQLRSAGVPEFLAVRMETLSELGYLALDSWSLTLRKALIEDPELSDGEAGELCNILLHESRHAEQVFLVARLLARNHTPGEIATELRIPAAVAAKAGTRGLDAGDDEYELADSLARPYTTDFAAHVKTSEMPAEAGMDAARERARGALAALRAEATVETIGAARAAMDEVERWIQAVVEQYAAYRRIPFERDAHDVGDAAKLAYLRGSR